MLESINTITEYEGTLDICLSEIKIKKCDIFNKILLYLL
jgi:hypothetical protein